MTTPIQPGEILAGKYRVDKILGTGGMGYVVACHHIQLQQKVALKFLHSTMLENEEVVGRFLREAQAAVQIRSEHVVRVSDVGKLDDGAPYMVMEYLDGTDLKETLEKNGPFPVPTAVDYLLQACEALAEAHVLGIVHRDLKPNNLFLARKADGRACVKVLDFGISKLNASTPGLGNLTRTAATLGTPYYMAPEQLTSTRSVDVRADIWALGIVLYELISGALPFNGETLAELCIRIIQEQPVPLSTANPNVPPALWGVIARCLQKNREDRFNNVAEIAFALAPFGSESARMSLDTISRIVPHQLVASESASADPVAATRLQPGAMATGVRPKTETTGQVAWGHTNTVNARSSRTPLLIGVGSAAVLVLGISAWMFRSHGTDSAVASSAPTVLSSPAVPSSAVAPPTENSASLLTAAASATSMPSLAPPAVSGVPASSPISAPVASTRAAQAPRSLPKAETRQTRASKTGQTQQGVKTNSESLIEDRR